jgi:S-DNA-T family DNA segregation ATPase FtsK/SpoIIIE
MYSKKNHRARKTVITRNYKKSDKLTGKKKKNETKKGISMRDVFVFLGSEKMIRVYGILLLGFSILLFIAIASYIFTHTADANFVRLRKTQQNVTADNLAGSVGACVAYFFTSFFFGIYSIGLALLFFLYGVKLSFKKALMPLMRTAITVLITMSWFSMATGFFVSNGAYEYLAGTFGNFISCYLVDKMGVLVSILITIVSFFVIGILCYDFTFKNLNSIKLDRQKKNDSQDDDDDFDGTPIPVSNDVRTNLSDLYIQDLRILDKEYDVNKIELPLEDGTYTPKQTEHAPIEDEVPFEIVGDMPEQEDFEEDESFADDIEDEFLLPSLEEYDPRKDLSQYRFPTLELLKEYTIKENDAEVLRKELIENKVKIETTLKHFSITIKSISAQIGPTVTLYEIVPTEGIRINKIKNLEDDIALSLSALGIRIIAPMPGKGTIGIEVPNKNPKIVSMREIIESEKFQNNKFDLPIGLGKTISNEPFVVDLAKMPHLLMAGATGQGKSVGLNAAITSLLYTKHPSELKFVMIDPKKVEFSLYSTIEKHYLAKLPDVEEPIITDTKKVIRTLNSLCKEMDERYDLLKLAKTKNIKEYNAKFCARHLSPANGHKYLPYIVLLIDEFGDLIMTAGREIETPIARLAQLARAIGIHLIIATQRPSVNIITGTIKANFPARIAFRVSSMVDSKTILDGKGANQLIGKGDMLISTGADLIRLQCAFVDTPEVENIVKYIEEQQGYVSAFELPEVLEDEKGKGMDADDINSDTIDDMFMDAASVIVQSQQGSTSLIQRKLSLGYNRAGRIMDQLEEFGIVGPSAGSKAREVKVRTLEELREIFQRIGLL